VSIETKGNVNAKTYNTNVTLCLLQEMHDHVSSLSLPSPPKHYFLRMLTEELQLLPQVQFPALKGFWKAKSLSSLVEPFNTYFTKLQAEEKNKSGIEMQLVRTLPVRYRPV
jgi:hypothetical protein